jgi:hypothetical protein
MTINEDFDIDRTLSDLLKQGKIDHKGFDKEGNDLFKINEKGLKYTINLLTSDPYSVMFLLKVALGSGGKDAFFKMLIHIAEHIKKRK